MPRRSRRESRTRRACPTDLLDAGAPGIHIITFNRHDAALALVSALGLRGA